MFWDRTDELAFLERAYGRPGAELLVIYGRRRVGKTRLIQEFLVGKPALYFMADQQLEVEQRRRFRDALARFLNEPLLANVEFRDWDTLLAYLDQRADWRRKIVLVLDEFQYLARSNPAFPSILQRLWDERFKERNLCLILCGSLIGMMARTTLRYDSPLYGRRTGQICLRPLDFVQYAECFPHLSYNERVAAYCITGGVPRYVELYDGRPDPLSWVEEHVLDRHSPLYSEPRFILGEEVSETTTYFTILQVIALGEQKMARIAGRLQLPANRLSKYLSTLMELDLVERRIPITEAHPEKSKRGMYRIADPFFRFWFRYVFPKQSELESGDRAAVREWIAATWDEFVSPAFEECCAQTLLALARRGELPFSLSRVGAWWDQTTAIDLLGLDEEQGTVVVGECKWSRQPVGLDTLAELQSKVQRATWLRGKRPLVLALFSRSGFTDALIARSREMPLILFSDGRRFDRLEELHRAGSLDR